MKKLMITLLAVAGFSTQALPGAYTWSDFRDDNRFSVTTGATAEAGDAYTAALDMIAGLKSGIIPRNLRLVGDATDNCVNPTTGGIKAKALAAFIAEGRANNSKVDVWGFKINGPYYSETGVASFSATISGDMPCLKK